MGNVINTDFDDHTSIQLQDVKNHNVLDTVTVVSKNNLGSVILGGNGNKVERFAGFIGSGYNNHIKDGNFSAIINGVSNKVQGNLSLAVSGFGGFVNGYEATVLNGDVNIAEGAQTTVLNGAYNKAKGLRAAVLGGSGNLAANNYSVVLGGAKNKALGQGSLVGGGYSSINKVLSGGIAYSDGSIALGIETVAGTGTIDDDNGTPNDDRDDIYILGTEEAVAMGYRAKAIEDKTLALGFDAKAEHTNSVALGSNAETRVFTQVDGTEAINGLKYKDFTGFADGVVSVGKTAHEKQIINVAPGEISQTSTDAINGSQLYATTIVLGNVATSVKDNLGGNAAIDENGNITFTDIGGTGKGTIHEAIGDVKTALGTKLEASDIQNITSSDQSVVIGANKNVATGQVDLKVNVDNSTLEVANGKVSVKDGGISTGKLADGAVTESKLADDAVTEAKIADALLTELKAKSREKVTAGDGIKVSPDTVAAETDNQAFTVSLSDAVKAKLDNLADDANDSYLDKLGSNVGNKVTFGENVGTATLADTTELAQIKAVKAVDDKVNTNTQDITDLAGDVTTKLDKKANRDASNLNANDVAAWKAKIDTNSIETVTAGEGIDVSGGTAATNKEWVVALSQETKTKLAKIDDNETALAGKANISLDNITPAGKAVIKDTAREAVEVAVNPATDGVLKLVKTASAANHKDTYTLSIDETKLNDKVGETFAKKDAENLGAGDVTKWKQKLGIDGLATNTNIASKLEAGDISSVDKTVTIDTTGTGNKGKVDLKVNIDDTTLTKDGNGVISLADNAVTTAKILDANVTKAKLADDVTSILDKVGTGAVETGNQKTVTGDVVKTYVDTATAGKLNKTDLNVIESDDITISNDGDLTKGNVKLSLKADKVKELAGTTNLATTYLKVDGANIAGNKVTFGGNVGTATLADTTELAQIKAVKAVDDKVTANATALGNKANVDLSNLTATGTTVIKDTARGAVEVAVNPANDGILTLAKATANNKDTYTLSIDDTKLNDKVGETFAKKDASNLTDPADVGKWKEKLGIDGLATNANIASKLEADDIISTDKTVGIDTATTAGKVDLKVNLDGTTLTKNGEGVISLADNAVTTAKILDANVTKAKLADDVTSILDKVGTGAIADGNTNTVTGDVVKTYVDTATAGKLNEDDLNIIESDDITVSNGGDLTKGNVQLSLKADKVKELAGTTDLATTYLNVSGANVGDKATFGGNVGTATLADTTELAQIKAVKAVDDKVTGNTQSITNLGDQITNVGKTSKEEVAIVQDSGLTLAKTDATNDKGAIYTLGLDAAKVKEVVGTTTLPADLAAKANKDASNLTDPADVGKWKEKLGIDGLATNANIASKLEADDIISTDKTVGIDTATTAGKVDLKVNLDGTTLTKNGEGVISLADNAVTTAKILDANVTKAKLADDVTSILDKVGTGAIADGNTNTVTGDVVKTYVDTATAGKLNKTDLNVIESDDITISNDGDLTKGNVKLSLKADKVKELAGTTNLATTYLKVDGSNVGNKVAFGSNVGKDTITGSSTQLVQEGAVKAYVDAVDTKVTNLDTTVSTQLGNKADKDAENLGAGDVTKWKQKLGIDGLATNANIASKLEAGDISSVDKTVTIDTTGTGNKGKVDLKVNLDGTTLTKAGNGVISLADNAVTTAKILDANVTKAKLADDVTSILDKVGTGAIADGNTNTVTGDTVKTYVDGQTSGLGNQITNLGNNITNATNIDITKWQEAILPTISFFSGGTGTGANYAKGADAGEFDLSKLAFDFGDGLKVEKQQSKDGKQIAHITLDKDALKNDPNFKGAKGDDGAAGADGQSAYEIWKAQAGNNAKTQVDFLAALKGEKGDKGDKGDAGNGNGGNGAEIKVAVTDDVVLDKDNLSKEEVVSNKGALSIKVGKNLNAKTVMNGKDKQLVISTTPEIKVDKVTVGNITLNQSGLTVKEGADVNINMGGNQIHNIKAGTAPTDAVNVSQLAKVEESLSTRIDSVEKAASGGTASAMASASLPQAYVPGKSMVSLAGASYDKSSSMAVGLSSISDNGKWIIKGNINANTEKKFGIGVGVGYQW
ncbi:YadA-like family protein [Pasteurella skyensis]|nr:YadA-like family protein [Pasteurella skyensis]MDP8161596.1 YadA-like family protein [Pasteurella skyensis]MDP8175990.1 YadA-like family protein [Pasteurella skyensis]MDP8177958.1 YadA-like family protein [Pasteurella skyensis]MDP8182383.1 YadA-like family protein [Pasteurella skyensis]MDP8198589.1 YadA-like family protein [Pasteurella skyensis]